jgi:uncharacterized protein
MFENATFGQKLLSRFADIVVVKRKAIIIGYCLITGLLLAFLPGLNVIVDSEKILPQSHPYVISTDAIERTFGFKQTAVILVTADKGDVFDAAFLDGLAKATEAVRSIQGVKESSVLSITADRAKSIDGDSSGVLTVRQLVAGEAGYADRATIEKRLSDWPLFDPVLVSRDRKSAAIIASFASDPKGFKHLVSRIDTAVGPMMSAGQHYEVGGHPSYIAAIERYSSRVALFFGLAIILIGLLHYDAFRSWQGVVLPIGTGVMAVIWVMGLISILKLPLDSFNATAPLFIFAVAAGHSVQLLKRYYEELAETTVSETNAQAANHAAVKRTLVRVGPVLIAAGCVGSGSFFSLLAFSVETIRVFGVLIGLGILSAVLIELGFMSAVRASFLPKLAPPSSATRWQKISRGFANVALKQRPRTFMIAASLIIVSLLGVARLNIDNSYLRYFGANTPVRQLDSKINASLAGANTLFAMLDTGQADGASKPATMAALCQVQKAMAAETHVKRTISLCDYMRRIDTVMSDGSHHKMTPDMPENLIAQYLQLYRMSGGPEDLDYLIDSDGQRAVVIAFRDNDSSSEFQAIEARIRNATERFLPNGAKLAFGGSVATGAALNDTMVQDKVINMAQIGIILCLLSALLFRSLIAGLLVVAPLAVTVSVILGIMGLVGIPLQLVTVSIAATAVGIGSDYAIYWLYRFREAVQTSQTEGEALDTTFQSAGQAILYVATSVTCGYSLLMLSLGFNVHFWLGLMVSLSMAVAALATMTLLPALVMLFRPRFLFDQQNRLPTPDFEERIIVQ